MRPHRQNFRPKPRGSLSTALAKPSNLERIAPESPRPVELLKGMRVDGNSTLTSDDAALHDLLLSSAYEADRGLTADMHTIPMAHVLHYFGAEARRDAIKASLGRLLKNTVSFGTEDGQRYEQVPLLVSWLSRKDDVETVHFGLPDPMRRIMTEKREFAYLELAALPKMKCKFSQPLYRVLLAKVRESRRVWIPGEDNTVVVTASVDEIGAWVGFPREKDGSIHSGKLRTRMLENVARDFDRIQAFKIAVNPVRGTTRGNPIIEVEFELTLAAADHRRIRANYDSAGIKQFGGTDVEEYRARSDIWLKAINQLVATDTSHVSLSHQVLFRLWTAAINEMLTQEPISEGYHNRIFRGESLRDQIDRLGPDAAAWGFIQEEAEDPDLLSRSKQERIEIANVGEVARRERVWGADAKPVASTPAKSPVQQAPAIRFESCGEIRLTLNNTLTTIDAIEEMVLDPIQYYRAWSGEQQKTIRVQWCLDGADDHMVFRKKISEHDAMELSKRFSDHIEGAMEYAA
ncbi:replication initiation protein [Sinorhizobium fredii]|uniref:replication initiation protein n=1 Tax=Rhizobium fredii TaxID=380 RepID=UPI00186593A2|nr:replication initiation protein [Sinorhizobium fredii]